MNYPTQHTLHYTYINYCCFIITESRWNTSLLPLKLLSQLNQLATPHTSPYTQSHTGLPGCWWPHCDCHGNNTKFRLPWTWLVSMEIYTRVVWHNLMFIIQDGKHYNSVTITGWATSLCKVNTQDTPPLTFIQLLRKWPFNDEKVFIRT